MRLVALCTLAVLAIHAHAFGADRVGDGEERELKLLRPIPPTHPKTTATSPAVDPATVTTVEKVAATHAIPAKPSEVREPESVAPSPAKPKPAEPERAEQPKETPPDPVTVAQAKVRDATDVKPLPVKPVAEPAVQDPEPVEPKVIKPVKLAKPDNAAVPAKPLPVRPEASTDSVESKKEPVPAKPKPLALPDADDAGPLKPLAIRPGKTEASATNEPRPLVPLEKDPGSEVERRPLAQAEPVPEPAPLSPLPMTSVPKPNPGAVRERDLAGDLPGTVSSRERSPFHVEMEDFKIGGVPSPKSKRTMDVVAELKKLVGLVSHDLDAGGRERTRLVYNTESISKEISTLAEMWSEVPPLVSACVKAKRASLVLEEELREEPRRWTHVRWAFQGCQKEIRQLRQTAARLAALEPQLVRVKRKGKVFYVEPEQSPEELAREAEQRRLQDLKDELKRNREREKDLKDTKNKVPLEYGM